MARTNVEKWFEQHFESERKKLKHLLKEIDELQKKEIKSVQHHKSIERIGKIVKLFDLRKKEIVKQKAQLEQKIKSLRKKIKQNEAKLLQKKDRIFYIIEQLIAKAPKDLPASLKNNFKKIQSIKNSISFKNNNLKDLKDRIKKAKYLKNELELIIKQKEKEINKIYKNLP